MTTQTLTKAKEKAAEVLANRKIAYSNKVRSLTGHAFDRAIKGEMLTAFTQQITNYSVLGNAYLQWPTRKVK